MGMYGRLMRCDSADTDRLAADPEALFELVNGDSALDLDKAWMAVGMLVGAIAESGMLFTDQVMPVGDDLGYGPAQFIEPAHAATIAEALVAAGREGAAAVWETVDQAALYPALGDWGPDELDWVWDRYEATVALFAGAASTGTGVLLAIV